jgi:hypothetical protein
MTSSPLTRLAGMTAIFFLFLYIAAPLIFAQSLVPVTDTADSPDTNAFAALPDAPVPHLTSDASAADANHSEPEAKITAKYIPAGWQAQRLDRRQKLNVALRDLYTPQSLAGYILAGGYSHLTNGQPNYGTNGDAFGKRVGAAFARDTSQAVFTDAVFAPLLDEDPRYYVQGPSYGILHRTVYAITRPLITRTDQGQSTVNGSLLLGYGAAAVLTSAYYPQSNRNATDIARTYGTSLGGAAAGFLFEEFSADILEALHLHQKQNH